MALLRDKEIYEWYKIIQECKQSGLSGIRFCKDRKIKRTRFAYFHSIFNFLETKEKDYAEKLKIAAHDYNESPGSMGFREIEEKYSLSKGHLKQTVSHLRYLEAVRRAEKTESKEMNFIPIQAPQKITQPESATPKNDIELSIKQGVKVICSPDTSQEKIIAIIEFLKGL